MKTFKKIWFLVLLALLFLPMMQTCFHMVDEKPLDGAFVEAEKPVIAIDRLINETLQDPLMVWCTEQTGFRKSMIRLNNQLMYSVFGETTANGVVKGKDRSTFFVMPYIKSYTGETYLGKDLINKRTQQIKLIQDMLNTKGVTLLPVFVPGKASYYPELIPDKYIEQRHETNNYEEYLKAFAEQGVEIIDFNRWFCDRKGTEAHAIYCNLGSHWTVYGASLAMDSLVNYMESKNHKAQVHAYIKEFDSTYLLEQDDEIYRIMNLTFPIKHNTIDQPKFGYTEGYRPKVLAISDSYWWAVYASDIALHQRLFSNGGYWYYNKTIYPKSDSPQNIESINYKKEIENQEFVLLVCTEASNNIWPYNFIERYLRAYDDVFRNKQPDQYDTADSLYSAYKNERIESIIQHIKNSPEWFENIKSYAVENGFTLEQSLWNAAEYSYRTNLEPIEFD
jgi:hypothetical protein